MSSAISCERRVVSCSAVSVVVSSAVSCERRCVISCSVVSVVVVSSAVQL